MEMVFVLSLIGVFASMALPRLRQSPSLQVQSMARMLTAQLENARSFALGQRMVTKIVFDEALGSYKAYADDDRNGTIAQTEAEMAAFQGFGARELEALISFGRGNASPLPGDGLSGAVTLTGDELELNVQGLPEPWGTMGTVYLVHQDDPNAVSAVSVSSSGSFKAWQWFDGEWR